MSQHNWSSLYVCYHLKLAARYILLKISFFETRSRFFLFLSRFLRQDRDFCFPYLVFRDEIEIFAFLISFFETRSRFFLSLSRFSRRFETKSRAKSHEIFRDRDISLGSAMHPLRQAILWDIWRNTMAEDRSNCDFHKIYCPSQSNLEEPEFWM